MTVCNSWILALRILALRIIALSDEDFKYLVEELGSEKLELLEQNVDYPYEYMNSFESFNVGKLSATKYFSALQKMEKLVMMVKYETVT